MYWASGLAAFTSSPVTNDQVPNQDVVANYTATAREFLSHVPVDAAMRDLDGPFRPLRRDEELQVAIAGALGMELIAPELDGLQTYDGSHLDRPSAERWSEAFFEAAGAQGFGGVSTSRSIRARVARHDDLKARENSRRHAQ